MSIFTFHGMAENRLLLAEGWLNWYLYIVWTIADVLCKIWKCGYTISEKGKRILRIPQI